MNKQQIRKRISEVVCTEATAASIADFMATHQPFEKLSIIRSLIQGDYREYIDEQIALEEHVVSNDGNHRFVIIQGDAGTGKSHLIRWMKEQYKYKTSSKEEAVIFISRSKNTLQGALTQIINSEDVPQRIKDQEMQILTEARRNLSGEDLRHRVMGEFYVVIKSDKEQSSVLSEETQSNIGEFLMNEKIKQYIFFRDGGPVDRIIRRIESTGDNQRQDDVDAHFSPEDFLLTIDHDLIKDFQKNRGNYTNNVTNIIRSLLEANGGETLSKNLSDYFNKKIEYVIQRCAKLDASDLRRVFDKIRTELKKEGKSLALFIEDFTSFTGLDKALMDVLINDNRAEEDNHLCRLVSVIGVTSSYYEHYIPDNVRQRATSVIQIKDDFDIQYKERLHRFTARYMNALSLSTEVIMDWSEHGHDYTMLPINDHSGIPEWALVTLEDGRKVSIYPFTKNMLSRVFEYMGDEKTPRQYLNVLFHHLYGQWLLERDDYPLSLAYWQKAGMDLQSLKTPVHAYLKDKYPEESERISCLLRIWGDGTLYLGTEGDEITIGEVPKSLFRDFGLPLVEGVIREETDKPFEGDNIIENRVSQGNSLQHKVEKVNKREYDKVRKNLDDWIKESDVFRHHETLRRDLIDFTKSSINWWFEEVPIDYVSEYWNMDHVYIENQLRKQDENTEIEFIIKISDDSYHVLNALAAWRHLGNKSWNFDDAQLHLERISLWLEINKPLIIDFIMKPKKKELQGYDLIELAFIQEILLLIFDGKMPQKISAEDIYLAIYRNDFSLNLDTWKSDRWNELYKEVEKNTGQHKKEHVSNMRLLFSQVGIKKMGETGNMFFDARKGLQIIENISSDFEKFFCILQDVKLSNYSTNKLHDHAVNFISRFGCRAIEAIKDETEQMKLSMNHFISLIGDRKNREPLQNQLSVMCEFLEKVKSTIPYKSNVEIVNKIKASDVEVHESEIEKILMKDFNDQLVAWAQNWNVRFAFYVNVFDIYVERLSQIENAINYQLEQLSYGDDNVVLLQEKSIDFLDKIEKALA